MTRAGISARQRKDELERLNEQLRKINMGLRQQARAGTIYAPGLTYLPATGAAAPACMPLYPFALCLWPRLSAERN
jgi:hypothetical protein